MILLIGKTFTKQADTFLHQDKEYEALVYLGVETATYDPEGEVVRHNFYVPTKAEVEQALMEFQGQIAQIPPMFSAKKIQGKKLYTLARQGIEIERKAVQVTVQTTLLSYEYPYLKLHIQCSKGTYIRSIAHDLGQQLTCGAYLKKLTRTRCGPYSLDDCFDGNVLLQKQI